MQENPMFRISFVHKNQKVNKVYQTRSMLKALYFWFDYGLHNAKYDPDAYEGYLFEVWLYDESGEMYPMSEMVPEYHHFSTLCQRFGYDSARVKSKLMFKADHDPEKSEFRKG